MDNNADGDLLTRGQADARYVKMGEAGSITTGMLQDGAVTTAKFSDNAVTAAKIQDETITVRKLSDSSVTSAKILDGSILFSDLGSNGCGANQVMKWNGSVWTCGNDEAGAGGDNLGDHVATQNVRLNGNWLSGDGENEGIFVSGEGKVGIGRSSPNEQVEDLSIGLDAVQRLRPVSFKWKDREEYDLGLIAEEVADVDPILVSYSSTFLPGRQGTAP